MIHQHVTPRTLGFVRCWVFGIWLLKIVPDPFYLLAELPISIFVPYRIVMRFIPTEVWPFLLNAQVLYSFKFALLTFLVLSMLGVRPYRPIAITTTVMLTFHQGLVRGFGHINHSEFALLYTTYVLALFPAADGFVWWQRKTDVAPNANHSVALLLMTLLMLFTFTATASFRLAHGTPSIFLSDSMKQFMSYHAFRPSYYGFGFGEWVLESSGLALLVKLSFPIVTLFEFLSPLCLIARCFRHIWLAVMIPFHLATFFFLNIFFWENLLLFSVLLIDIDRFISARSTVVTPPISNPT